MSVCTKSMGKDGKPKVSKFDKLANHVAAEYRAKGDSAKTAREIGKKVAGKVAAEKGK